MGINFAFPLLNSKNQQKEGNHFMHTLTLEKTQKTEDSMTVELFLAVFFLWFSVLGLGVDLHYAAVAFLGASSGSLVLGYFKPEENRKQQFVKALMSTISGVFCGAAFAKYYGLSDWEFLAMGFFFNALVSLILLKAIVGVLDTDGGAIVRAAVGRIFVVNQQTISVTTKSPPEENRGG
jgi:hypothetical protein